MQIFLDMMATSIVGSVSSGIIFWNQILDWADRALFPWVKENFSSELEYKVRNAFAALDKFVIPIRNHIKALKKFTEIKEAWEMLRKYLLKVSVQFERNARNQWVKRITYWVICNLKSKQVVRTVAEELVDFDSLPPDVRQEWVKRGNTTQNIDMTQLRDRELEMRDRELKMILEEDEEIEDVDSLPDDVRQEWVKRGNTTQNIDMTQLRDRELKMILEEDEQIEDVDSLSDDVRQKSHIKGWVTNILLEDWRGELETLRSIWYQQRKPEFWIKIMTGFCLLEMLKAYLQIKVENIWLSKRKQG